MTALLPLHDESGHRPGPPALVLVAHGSRDPRTLATVHGLLDRIRELRPGLRVHLGHIELNAPLLPDTLAALGDDTAILVPLLLSRGYHVKQDIPEMAAAARARTRIAAPLGPHRLLVETLHRRLTEAGWRTPATESARRSAGVVLAAAAHATPTPRSTPAVPPPCSPPAWASRSSPPTPRPRPPTVPEAVRVLRSEGRHDIALASYFTAPGRFSTECAQAAPGTAAAPLGAHPLMARLILTRYDETRSTTQASHPLLASA
ncbi:CbiX/SirB N-terminal domain-containing protein [Streptomyces cinereospinus]